MRIGKKKILYKDWIYEWLIEKREYIKESTYANYSNNIFNHIIPKLGSYELFELNHKIIQNFFLFSPYYPPKNKKDIIILMISELF